MSTRKQLNLFLFVVVSLLTTYTFAQSISSKVDDEVINITSNVFVEYDQLRNFVATGELIDTKNRGPLSVEIRNGVYANSEPVTYQPASIVIRLRNRLVAAATGYRLGSALSENGIIIDSWDGSKTCVFTRWELEFAGERMVITKQNKFRAPKCEN